MLQLHGGFRVRVKVSVRVLFRQTHDEWMGPKVHFFRVTLPIDALPLSLKFQSLLQCFKDRIIHYKHCFGTFVIQCWLLSTRLLPTQWNGFRVTYTMGKSYHSQNALQFSTEVSNFKHQINKFALFSLISLNFVFKSKKIYQMWNKHQI